MGYEKLGLLAMRLLAITETTRATQKCLSSLYEGRIALCFLPEV